MQKLGLSLFAAIVAISPLTLIAQTGPGGVGNSTTNPYWLDAHTMGGSNGSLISNWTDHSGNGNDAVQGTPSMQPTYSTNALNGRDAIVFGGSQGMQSGAEANMDNATFYQFYMVGTINNASALSIPFNVDYGSGSPDEVFTGFYTQSGSFRTYGRRITSLITATFASSSGINSYMGEYNLSSDYISANRNFSQDAINVNPPIRSTSAHEAFWVGGGPAGYYSQATIGDVFVFTFDPNTAQQNIIENYLSAKYGVAATTDMYSFEGTYGLGVVGIGRDNVANSHTDSQGNGYVRISNPDDLNDGEYLFIGHDDVAVTSFNLNTNVPSSLPGSSRFVRQWRAEKTGGDLGNITLVFDLDVSTDFSPDPNNYRLLVDSDADMSGTIDHIVSGTYNAGDQTITFTNVDLQTGDYFTLCGDTPPEIHSIATGNWSSTSTWDCTCIPTSFNDVYIDPGHNVTVDQDAFVNYFSIDDPTSTLTMNANFTLNIAGDFDNIGTLNATDGTIAMVGGSNQYIDAGGGNMSFHNLKINNSGGSNVDLFQSVYRLTGELTIDQGTLTVDNTGPGILIVESTGATTGGRIGKLAVGTDLIGFVRVERNLPGGTVGWRNMATGVVGAQFVDWDPDLEISGPGMPDGCAYDSTCFHSILYWEQSIVRKVNHIDTAILNKRGFEIFVGDDLNNFSGTTLTSEGTIHDPGNVVKSMGTGGWWTLGNPYACPITFSSVTKTSQVGDYYYVYDPVTQGYQWYDGSSNTSSVPEITSEGLIASGQGFWVFLSSAGSLTYDQDDKSSSDATFIRGQEKMDISLYFDLKEEGTLYQQTIAFEQKEGALDGLDSVVDMRSLYTGHAISSQMSILVEDEHLAKNFIDMNIYDKSFTLTNQFAREGYYSISARNIENFNDYQKVYLYDNIENEYVDMKQNGEYVFYSDSGYVERFTVIFTNEMDASGNDIAGVNDIFSEYGLNITVMGNVVNIISEEELLNVNVSVYNTLGQLTHTFGETSLFGGANLFDIPLHLSGVQILTIQINGQIITKKLVF